MIIAEQRSKSDSPLPHGAPSAGVTVVVAVTSAVVAAAAAAMATVTASRLPGCCLDAEWFPTALLKRPKVIEPTRVLLFEITIVTMWNHCSAKSLCTFLEVVEHTMPNKNKRWLCYHQPFINIISAKTKKTKTKTKKYGAGNLQRPSFLP